MTRKKAKIQVSKKTIKQTTPFTLVQTMEKTFREAPAKLILQCQKDIVSLKKQEQKLAKTLKKNQDQKKTTSKKIAALNTKSKTSFITDRKKQITTLQKFLTSLEKEITTFTAQLEQIKKHCETLTHKQKQFATINKLITTLEKTETKKKTQKNKTTKNTTKKMTKKIMPIDQPQTESMTKHSDFQVDTTFTIPEPAEMES